MLTELRRSSYDRVPQREIATYWKQIAQAPFPIDRVYSRADQNKIYGPGPIFEPITPSVVEKRRQQATSIVRVLKKSGVTVVAEREAVAFDQITCLQCDHVLPNSTTRIYRFKNPHDIDIKVSKEGVATIIPSKNARYNHTLLTEEALHAFAMHTLWEAPFSGRIVSLDVQQLKSFFENPFGETPTEYQIEKTSFQRPTA